MLAGADHSQSADQERRPILSNGAIHWRSPKYIADLHLRAAERAVLYGGLSVVKSLMEDGLEDEVRRECPEALARVRAVREAAQRMVAYEAVHGADSALERDHPIAKEVQRLRDFITADHARRGSTVLVTSRAEP